MMKGFRKIVVNDKTYMWRLIRNFVVIICPDGEKFPVSLSVLTGWSSPDIERGMNKRYFSVTPKDVAEFIKKEIDK